MPRNNDDIEQGNSPITPPEGDIEEQEVTTPEPVSIPEPVSEPESSGKWNWVGAPSRPEAQEEGDGISDLFRVTAEDVGASEEDLSDLTDVDIERDVLDADEDGSLDDLVSVTEEDIMGDDDYAQRPSKPPSKQLKTRRKLPPRYQPPTSMGRSG